MRISSSGDVRISSSGDVRVSSSGDVRVSSGGGRGEVGLEGGEEGGEEGGLGGLVLAEGGTEEEQGLEMELLGGIVERQVVENAIGVEEGAVLLAGGVGVAMEDTAAEDLEEVALHLVEEIGSEDLVGSTSGDFDIVGRTLEELEGEDVVEDGDAEGEPEGVALGLDGDNGGVVAFEEALADANEAALCGGVGGEGSEGVALAVLDEECDEGAHLVLSEADGAATTVAHIVQVEASQGVPVFVKQEVYLSFGGSQKHEAVEIAPQGVVGGLSRGQKGIGYEMEERGLALFLSALECRLEHFVDGSGLRMAEDVPEGFVLVETDGLKHSSSLPLRRAFGLHFSLPERSAIPAVYAVERCSEEGFPQYQAHIQTCLSLTSCRRE